MPSLNAYISEYRLKQELLVTLKLNQSNILCIYGKILDYYTMLIMAFNSQVSWYPGHTPKEADNNNKTKIFDGQFITSY